MGTETQPRAPGAAKPQIATIGIQLDGRSYTSNSFILIFLSWRVGSCGLEQIQHYGRKLLKVLFREKEGGGGRGNKVYTV